MKLVPDLLSNPGEAVATYTTPDAARMAAARGDDLLLAHTVDLASTKGDSDSFEERATANVTLGLAALWRGDTLEAVRVLERALDQSEISGEMLTLAYGLIADAAFDCDDTSIATRVLARLEALTPVGVTPVRLAQRARFRAEQDHRSGDQRAAEANEREATDLLRSVSAKPFLVSALLDAVRRRGDKEALAEARAICEELGATRWLQRIDATLGSAVPA
jgi:hypothetical protein